MRFSLIFQICRVQTLIFSIDIYMYGIKCKKLLLMLYVHWIRVVSFSCLPCRNSACAHIHSSHMGYFLGSVSNTIYRWVIKYSWYIKKMTVDVRYVFVSEIQVWNKDHTVFLRLLCVFWWSESMPFAWCLWGVDSFLFGFVKESNTTTWAWSISIQSKIQIEAVETHTYKRNVGYIIIVKLKWLKKVKGLHYYKNWLTETFFLELWGRHRK